MNILDWLVIGSFFIILVMMSGWAFRKISASSDFYMAGGKLPWWLAGVSHHVSGYSGVVFTGYVAIAYGFGFSLYVWWAFGIALSCFIGAYTILPRWARLRQHLNVQSPTEYLKTRYNLKTQQLIAYTGVLLKLLDVAGKYTAIGILLHAFTDLPFYAGVILSGTIVLIYVTVGGLWADAANDFFQFLIQVIAGTVMFFTVSQHLSQEGLNYLTMWSKLPAENGMLFNEPYTANFALVFLLVIFLSYTGGTWNLAAKFMATSNRKEAKKSGLLSGVLYLIWPLIMFAPMWAAPLLFPNVPAGEQSQVYALLTQKYLPNGLIGLVLASMFAATLSMVASDCNAISSVVSRDILPALIPGDKTKTRPKTTLRTARTVTLVFTFLTLVISLNNQYFGGVIGLTIKWFGALLGPAAIPMILGLLPTFKYSGPKAAWSSIMVGLLAFILVNYFPGIFGVEKAPLALSVGLPVVSSLLTYITYTVFKIEKPSSETAELLEALK